MSRRRSTSSVMGPPPDRDVVMGPPPVPAPLSAGHAPQQKPKEGQEITEKYKKLKRRFFELEEKHKETSTELQRSGERNVKMREERNVLLDRIIELEAQPQFKSNGSSSVSPPHGVPLSQPSSSAFPRTLLNARARTSFIANLRQAIAEDDADDDVDPLLTSRHVGPQARRREEEERRERLEEEARDSRKGGRRTRGSQHQPAPSLKGKESITTNSGQPPLTFAPHNHNNGSNSQGTSESTAVSGPGTKLRIKPPVPPSDDIPSPSDHISSPTIHNAIASSSSHSHQPPPLPSTHSHPHSYTHPPPPPPPHLQQLLHHSPPPQHQYSNPPRSVSPQLPAQGESGHRDSPAPSVHEPDRSSGTHKRSNSSTNTPPVSNEGDQHDNQTPQADGPALPMRSETVATPSSRPDGSAPSSVTSRRENLRPRRSGRTTNDSQREREEATADTAAPSSRKPATRSTRRVSRTAAAAAAQAEAEAQAKAQAEAEALAEAEARANEQAAAKAKAELDAKRAEEAEAQARAEAEVEAKAQAEAQVEVEQPAQPEESVQPEAEVAPDVTPEPPTKVPSPPTESTSITQANPTHKSPSPVPQAKSNLGSPPEPAPAVSPTSAEFPTQLSEPSNVTADVEMADATATDTTNVESVEDANIDPSLKSLTPSFKHLGSTSTASPAPAPSTPSANHDVAMQAPDSEPQVAADGLAKSPSVPASAPLSAAGPPSTVSQPSSKEVSPTMENIVKVAEAAIAAQNAANAVISQTPAANSPSNQSTASVSSPANSLSTPSPSTTTAPATKLHIPMMNPMAPGPMTITTAAHPMAAMTAINPYSLYYPSPNTPVTPNTPTYAHPYANPYYYLAAAPMAGPSGLYAPNPGFIPPPAPRPPSEAQRQTKPKRLKAHTVTSRSFSIPMVPRDKKGKPMLPLNVGIMTVINLGDVCMREHFHTERYIFPVGYEVTRRYLSTVDPNIEVVYHCTILDGGDGPKFQIVPSDVPDRPVIAGTATGAWSNIVKQANAIRNRQHSNSVSGPDFFGLGQNTIKHLIQELPNADRLRDYVWQNFVEGGPLGGRHAAVIPALPEEYDASMPIGAYYPSKEEKLKREASQNPESPRGMSHYPQHIVAQAEAQRAQQQAIQQAQQQAQQSGQAQVQQPQQAPPAQKPQPAQQGLTQIVLPPPTTSETLNIQEYQPPAPERRTTRQSIANSNAARTASQSPAPGGRGARPTSRSPSVHQTRSNSRTQPQHSPYLANANAPASTATPPPVPATFASIMNAYPAPTAAGNSASPKNSNE